MKLITITSVTEQTIDVKQTSVNAKKSAKSTLASFKYQLITPALTLTKAFDRCTPGI